ncbi:DoxX family membrane protein [Lentzea sp. PSKA42]|uniref:DoxX family membrane protein n=1 Tax=Lentzea indica TaxID=2604800 RepID=A0ABX1FTT6_9PSEU|nr:DoxX family membrane protein [Lentzea indica]NKE62454.1 DoxX family membrane protein [Lentzea indica]
MVPLIALVVVTSLLLLAGALGIRRLKPLPVALRGGLAVMFVLTGGAHFIGLREELIAMVPPLLPAPGLLVTATGVLELLGAAALLWSRTAGWSALGLTAMLVVMFPANVHKALSGPVPWDDQLVPRTLMQVVFLAATVTVAGHYLRRREGVVVA